MDPKTGHAWAQIFTMLFLFSVLVYLINRSVFVLSWVIKQPKASCLLISKSLHYAVYV